MKFILFFVGCFFLEGCSNSGNTPNPSPSDPTCPGFPERKLDEVKVFTGDDSTIYKYSYGNSDLNLIETFHFFSSYGDFTSTKEFFYEGGKFKGYKAKNSGNPDLSTGEEISNDSVFWVRSYQGEVSKTLRYVIQSLNDPNKFEYEIQAECGPVLLENSLFSIFYDSRGNIDKTVWDACGEINTHPYIVSEEIANPTFSFLGSQFIPKEGPNLVTDPFFFPWGNFESFFIAEIVLDDQNFPIHVNHKTKDLHIEISYID
jgi:hypothetical protein